MSNNAGLPKPYEEVFIWVNGARRVARLENTGKHFQLATFLADTKGQYLISVSDVQRWSPIVEAINQESLLRIAELVLRAVDNRADRDWKLMHLDLSEAAELAKQIVPLAAAGAPQ